ncbi:Folate gamma-glutamyl hydrolase [Quillaja saponaria]|uniref:Folate gamma-glutamyl hydrolase n=1 Tax=Quillaja saponaria TaxID=32244 RepID=A0AAD7LRD1_QUISA|nr:Folate gamma-glutamyl hydrolase [Quillaja saponaria]
MLETISPVYAVSLGFELLLKIFSKDQNILERFNASNQASTFVKNLNMKELCSKESCGGLLLLVEIVKLIWNKKM